MDSMYSLSYNAILFFFASDKLQNPSQVIAILQADFYNKIQNKMYSVFCVIVIVKSANL